ncbi:MAG: hypothetical protein ABIA11_00245 [Patescibacteria group bacterium]
MDPDITFTWKGKKYTVEARAYDTPHIVLPDGTVLRVTMWLETYPPKVGKAEEVNHLFKDMPVVEIAENMYACVAKLA